MRKTRIPTTCLQCGTVFEAMLCSLRDGHSKFCGMACYGASMRGKPSGRKGERRPKVMGANNPMNLPGVREKHKANLLRGADHPFWKGGVTSVYKQIRKSPEYVAWRTAIFTRDNYTCQECGLKPGMGKRVDLHADHIKPFSMFPELRFELNNGRTLCVPCHMKTDTYGGKILTIKKEAFNV